MARDGVFLKSCARIHERYHTPHIAIVALVVWSAILAVSGSYEQLFTYVVFASLLLHMLGALAVFRLRYARPDAPRPYRVWGYPIVPAAFIAASAAFVLNTLITQPKESLAGLGLLALGLPAYWYWKRSAKAA
jgi:APA family basic amino acid/polyamine antiporter